MINRYGQEDWKAGERASEHAKHHVLAFYLLNLSEIWC